MATTIKAGYSVTPGASEIEYTLDQWPSTNVDVTVVMISGSVQFGVGDNNAGNVITGDSNYATLSNANDTAKFNLRQKQRHLFAKGTGTFRIYW